MIKHSALDPPQRRRNTNTFNRALTEGVFPELLQPFVQLDVPQLLTALERAWTYFPHARWKNERLEAALVKAESANFSESIRKQDVLQVVTLVKRVIANTLEPVWEGDFREISALVEHVFSDCLKSTPFLKHAILQISAFFKCSIMDFPNPFWNDYSFYS